MKFKDLKEELFKEKKLLIKKVNFLEKKEETINERMREVDQVEAKVQELYEERRAELERVSALSCEEAREIF